MLHKTRGIVFHSTDYSETSVVSKIYTELFGLQSYLVNSVRKKKATVRNRIFQPLTLVDLVVYHKERGGLQRIAEVKAQPILNNIPFDVTKSSVILFLNEVLCKSIREEEANQQLFDYIFNSIRLLDLQEPASPDFHILFLLQLTKYLGFFPANNFDQNRQVFNLQDGEFQASHPPHPFFMDGTMCNHFHVLLKQLPDFSSVVKIPLAEKRELILRILEYYQLHLAGFGNVKSHKVLEQVWA